MNAEELEIARRLVACPKWAWLPGMAAFRPYQAGHLRIESTHESGFGMSPVIYGSCSWFSLSGLVPDLDDDLTRLGVLEVVRRAWNNPLVCPYPVKMNGAQWWNVGIPWDSNGGTLCGTGPTELDALLAAMESAPSGGEVHHG